MQHQQKQQKALDDLLRLAGFNAADIRDVHRGTLVKTVTESTSDRELAVKFAFLVKAPVNQLQEYFMTTTKTSDKDPSVMQSRVIQETGTLDDFADLVLEPNGTAMTKDYLNAARGASLNLSTTEIDSCRALQIGQGKGQKQEQECVVQHVRGILLNRYHAYREHGLNGIQPYARSGGKDYNSGEELRHKTGLAELLQKKSPSFHKHLLEYPHFRPDGLEECYSWVNYKIDDKPTVVLIHRMSLCEGVVYVFSERHLYVSWSHNSVPGISGAFPMENITVVAYVLRTSTDQVAGLGGATKRAIGARMMTSKVAENFERARNIFVGKAHLDQ